MKFSCEFAIILMDGDRMNKTTLTTQTILDKNFNVDFKGYSPIEVDGFLDLVLEDYQIFEANMQKLIETIEHLKGENAALKAQNMELAGRQKATENTTSFSSIDLLKRVSRLEQEIFKK